MLTPAATKEVKSVARLLLNIAEDLRDIFKSFWHIQEIWKVVMKVIKKG
jgi:hypothetical protein